MTIPFWKTLGFRTSFLCTTKSTCVRIRKTNRKSKISIWFRIWEHTKSQSGQPSSALVANFSQRVAKRAFSKYGLYRFTRIMKKILSSAPLRQSLRKRWGVNLYRVWLLWNQPLMINPRRPHRKSKNNKKTGRMTSRNSTSWSTRFPWRNTASMNMIL